MDCSILVYRKGEQRSITRMDGGKKATSNWRGCWFRNGVGLEYNRRGWGFDGLKEIVSEEMP